MTPGRRDTCRLRVRRKEVVQSALIKKGVEEDQFMNTLE
jgi:hypothetical protein